MIIPQPRSVEHGDGVFRLTAKTTVYVDGGAETAASALRRDLGRATGFEFATGSQESAGIHLSIEGGITPEAYTLSVTKERISIHGGGPAGLFYGIQVLRQLLPPEIFSATKVERTWELPVVEIEDSPQYRWRGAMLDVSRHFFDRDYILRLIDLAALHRLNVLHLHLTDDQGWRVEVPSYPKLTEVAAWREETLIGHSKDAEKSNAKYDSTRHGGFYTEDDLRDIVAYAAQRFVTIVPEIDLPGHTQAAVTAYPELGNTGEAPGVRTKWGISEHVLNVEDRTLDFCREVLRTVLKVFPSRYVHCGGDEVPKKQWQESESAQARMKELGLSDEDALQNWFSTQLSTYLRDSGRRFVGWDEVLEGGGPSALPSDTVIMSWRGEDGGVTAANAGLDVVMAPNEYAYLDHYQSEKKDKEPLAIGGHLPLEKVYSYPVLPEGLDEGAEAHVLGAQAQLWTEYVPTTEQADYMFFPRLCAFAEAVWRSPEAERDFAEFRKRLERHLWRLDQLGVKYRSLD